MSENAAIICLIGGSLGFVGFVISLICVAMVAGFTRSTHTVQYMPHEQTTPDKTDQELIAENEQALLDKVGKKKTPTVIEDLDIPLEQIVSSDINF